ncbi:hypothetical protein [Spongorhabdus nitratireducens]
MAKYLKCSRSNGLVMSFKLHDKPFSLCNPAVFWVQINPTAGKPEWQPTIQGDQVKFKLYSGQILPVDGQPVVSDGQGLWQHSINAEKAQQRASQQAERLKDMETHRLIKLWCEQQDEGSEEAFINLGIANAKDSRYLAYREAADEIRKLRR